MRRIKEACKRLALGDPEPYERRLKVGLALAWLPVIGLLLPQFIPSAEGFEFAFTIALTMIPLCLIISGYMPVLKLRGHLSGLFLTSAILYPSERERTERLYKSTMLIYALGILIMGLVNQLAVEIAQFLYVPDEALIDSIRVQAMFIANLIALTPVVAPTVHLARLIHAFERAREAEAIVRAVESY